MVPDLFIRSLSFNHTVVDVSSITPVPINGNSHLERDEAGKSDRAAKIRYKDKFNKYDTISKACQLRFQPFILETTGRIHKDSKQWLKNTIKQNQGGYN